MQVGNTTNVDFHTVTMKMTTIMKVVMDSGDHDHCYHESWHDVHKNENHTFIKQALHNQVGTSHNTRCWHFWGWNFFNKPDFFIVLRMLNSVLLPKKKLNLLHFCHKCRKNRGHRKVDSLQARVTVDFSQSWLSLSTFLTRQSTHCWHIQWKILNEKSLDTYMQFLRCLVIWGRSLLWVRELERGQNSSKRFEGQDGLLYLFEW